ncbi:aminoacyl-tRNA hydrolase [Candidatus Uhrbacteria bacterium]|nr:aminoacyl-tRNA hydrolase [Candidatus Uhrbacteria bacterium]
MAILIVGLGNPGTKYDRTRHNAGFVAVDHLADSWELGWKANAAARAEVAEANVNGKKVILAKPQTFMNLSGESVASLCGMYKVAAKDVWVAYDEAAIEPNQVRVRIGGSAGGHNGIKSIIEHVGEGFARIRIGIGIGIGAPPEKMPLEEYVLQKFSKDEHALMERKAEIVEDIIDRALADGVKEETITIQ